MAVVAARCKDSRAASRTAVLWSRLGATFSRIFRKTLMQPVWLLSYDYPRVIQLLSHVFSHIFPLT